MAYIQCLGYANTLQCFFGELLEKLVIYNVKTVKNLLVKQ